MKTNILNSAISISKTLILILAIFFSGSYNVYAQDRMNKYANGIYFYSLVKDGAIIITKKMELIK